MLHAMAEIAPAIFDLSPQSALLPIVPMFHAASWGLPFAGAAAGVKFVFSTTNDAATLHGLMLQEGITHSAGVPTVWLAMFAHLDAEAAAGRNATLGKLRLVTIGGSAAPRAMIERLIELHPYDIPVAVVLPAVGGYDPYLDWVRSITAGTRP
jgi:fatty-acyl-CoA synthase